MATERIEIVLTSRGTRRVQRDIRGIGQASQATRRALGFLRAALVVIASARVLQGFLDLADSFTNIRNRLRLLTDSTAELNTVQNALFQLSQRTRTAFEGNVELFFRTARSTRNLSLTFRDLLGITEATALALKVSGASAQEGLGGLRQFTQGLAAGALQGEELRSVVENLPRLADAIGREFGVAGGELIALNKQQEGIITVERVIKALRDEAGLLGEEFAQTTPTIADGFTRLNNSLILFFGGLSDATGVGAFFADLLLKIANNIDTVVLALAALAAVVVFNFLIAQLAALNATLIGLAASAVGFGRTLLLSFTAVLAPLALSRAAVLGFASASVTAFNAVARAAVVTSGAIATISSAFVLAARSSVLFVTTAVRRLAILTAATFSLTRVLGLIGTVGFLAIRALIAPVALLRNLFLALRVAVLANPLFLAGAALVAAVVGAFILLREQIAGLIPNLDQVKGVFNDVVTVAVAGVKTIISSWRQLPAAIADLAIQAGNNLVRFLEASINKVIAGLNRIPGVDITPVDLPTIRNAFEGAADVVANDFVGALESVREQGGGVKVVADQFQRIRDFLAQFTGGNLEIIDELLNNLPTIGGGTEGLGDASGELEKLRNSLERLLGSISPAIDGQLRLAEAATILSKAQEAGIDIAREFGISQEEVLRRVRREIVGVGNEATNPAEQQRLLAQAFNDGVISLNEYERALRSSRVAATALDDSLVGGLRNGLARIAEQLNDFNQQIGEAVVGAFGRATDAIVEFAQTGRLNLRQFFSDLFADLARLALNQTFASLLSGFGFGSGFGGGFGSLVGGLFGGGRQDGGPVQAGRTFLVGERGPELFTPRTSGMIVPNEALGAGGGRSVTNNVTLNITGVRDVDEFRRSEGQILDNINRSLRRSAARDS